MAHRKATKCIKIIVMIVFAVHFIALCFARDSMNATTNIITIFICLRKLCWVQEDSLAPLVATLLYRCWQFGQRFNHYSQQIVQNCRCSRWRHSLRYLEYLVLKDIFYFTNKINELPGADILYFFMPLIAMELTNLYIVYTA